MESVGGIAAVRCGFARASITFWNSTTEPGQPWVSKIGNAPGCAERLCRKWIPTPSM